MTTLTLISFVAVELRKGMMIFRMLWLSSVGILLFSRLSPLFFFSENLIPGNLGVGTVMHVTVAGASPEGLALD